jgi:hypothetical protein
MQDLWAQAMERLADKVGRQIRYGGTPTGDAAAFYKLMELGEIVGRIEELLDEFRRTEDAAHRVWISNYKSSPQHRRGMHPLRDALRDLAERVQRILAEIAAD